MQSMKLAALAAAVVFSFATASFTNHALAQDATEAGSTPEAVSLLMRQRGMAQHGLSIGLMSSLLQTRLALFEAINFPVGACRRFSGAGSVKAISRSGTAANRTAVVEIYYDNSCMDLYLRARLTAQQLSAKVGKITEVSTLTRQNGAALGTMRIVQTATQVSANKLQMSGTGTFQPPSGPAVKIGYNCGTPVILGATNTAQCNVGVAQTFAALGADLASITEGTITITQVATNRYKATFTASAILTSGAAGTLGITAPTTSSLQVTGTTSPVASADATGSVSRFGMFPPGPIAWQSTDNSDTSEFMIRMTAGQTSYNGGVDRTTGGALADFTVDNSGTGQITYSNNVKATIRSWLLAN